MDVNKSSRSQEFCFSPIEYSMKGCSEEPFVNQLVTIESVGGNYIGWMEVGCPHEQSQYITLLDIINHGNNAWLLSNWHWQPLCVCLLLPSTACKQCLLSPQILNQNQVHLPPSFGLRFPTIFDSAFPLYFGLFSPFLGESFVKGVDSKK